MTQGRLTLVVPFLLSLSLAACGGSGGTATVPANPLDPLNRISSATRVNVSPDLLRVPLLLPPSGTIYLGARVNPSPVVLPYSQTRVAPLEARIGRTLALDNHYYDWSVPFPGAPEADDLAHHRIPVIAWNCAYSNASVAAGEHDADINAAAANIKAYGHRIFLRWFWEMDLAQTANGRTACWDPATDEAGGQFSPVHFVAAWRHIRAVFDAQHVTNVTWLWNPSAAKAHDAAALLSYYPGDAAVDWVGFDAYALNAGGSFAETLSGMYSALSMLTSKPILVAETATVGSNQVAWLTNANITLAAKFPNVKGLMYFDAPGGRADWSLATTGDPTAMSVFKRFANTAYMSAAAPSGD